jgi:hypothetical protein
VCGGERAGYRGVACIPGSRVGIIIGLNLTGKVKAGCAASKGGQSGAGCALLYLLQVSIHPPLRGHQNSAPSRVKSTQPSSAVLQPTFLSSVESRAVLLAPVLPRAGRLTAMVSPSEPAPERRRVGVWPRPRIVSHGVKMVTMLTSLSFSFCSHQANLPPITGTMAAAHDSTWLTTKRKTRSSSPSTTSALSQSMR